MKSKIRPENQSLIKKNAYGNDKNLNEHGNKKGYLYSIGDGFNLLLSIRQNSLTYAQENGANFHLKAIGEEFSATRENNQRTFLADPYYIDNFFESLEDDIKTITGQHNIDQYGVDQRAKNNLWTTMPKLIVIPLLSDGHWRSIRIEIDYDHQRTNILYSDPYGSNSFYQALVDKVKPAIIQAVNTLISHHSAQLFVLLEDSIEEYHKQIDQQGKGKNAWDCGPITFRNIIDYTNINFLNADEDTQYTVSLATDPEHARQIQEIRVADITTYRQVAGIQLPEVSIQRMQQAQIAIKKSSEVYKAKIHDKAEEIYTKIHALPDELVQLIFGMIEDDYTEQKLVQVYNFVTEAAESALYIPDFASSKLRLWLSNTYNGQLTADGLKNTLHGNIFQLSLLTLAAIRAKEAVKGFYLITEAREFEKFDDLGIDYGDRITFLQAKHSAEGDTFSKADFLHASDDASLAKYFDSWSKLRQGEFVKLPDGKLKETKFIFFSNKGLKGMDGYIEAVQVENDEFALPASFKATPSYRIIKGEKREEFIKTIAQHSKTIKPEEAEELEIEDLALDKFEQEITKATRIATNKLAGAQKISLNGSNVGKGKGEEAIDKHVVLAVIKLASENEEFAGRLAEYTEDDTWNKVSGKFEIDCIKDALEVLRKRQDFDSVDTTPINQFLDEFIIKTAQPNVDQLFDIIKQEIGAQVNIGVQESYTGIVHLMLEWFRERNTCILTSDQFNQRNAAQQADLNRFYFLRFTQTFAEEFTDYPLDLQGLINQKLLEFLSAPKKAEQKFQILKGNSAKPIVYKTIKELKDLKDAEWIYIEYSDKLVQDITAIFQGESTRFLVVNCYNIAEFSEQQVRNIVNLIKNQGNVKVVLITRNNVVIPQSLLELEPQENSLEALSDEQIQALCKQCQNHYITLAGKEYKIQDIIDHKLGNIYELMKNIQYLAQIIEHAHEEQVTAESEMPYGVYIPNRIELGEGYYDLSIITRKNTQYYIVEGIEDGELLDELRILFQDNLERFAVVKNMEADLVKWQKADFILLKNPNLVDNDERSKIYILTTKPADLDQKKYIVLKPVEGFTTARLKVIENPCNLYLPFAGGIDFSYQGAQEEFLKDIITSGQLSVLMSPAGYGKTSFCRNIVEQHKLSKDISLPIWAIKIPLPKLQFDNQGQPNLAPFVNIHHQWEYEALQQDMHIKGRVLVVLDSFDEVKDAKALALINYLIQTIPREVSLLITTRPYAANKLLLPSGQNLVFYKLTEYTQKQRKEYFAQYIKAILGKIEIAEEVLNTFVEKVTDNVSARLNEHSSKILGIPLESYVFCELLKPHILAYIANNDNQLRADADIRLEHLDISNTAKLYQEFILSKSMLFLEKHLGIKPENIVKKSIIFNLMGAYNQVIELYALKQAFGITDITGYIRSINFDIDSLTTLEDTGLLKVSEDGSRLNFDHETYQEFYAALGIIRGLLSGRGDLFDLTKVLVEQNRYDPKFHFIFSVAAQFSVVGGSMIPGYHTEQHLLSFWEALGESGDIIGAGAVRLLKYCLAEFMEEQVVVLMSRVEGKPWARFIKDALVQRDKLSSDQSQETDGQELPITISDMDENSGDEQDIHEINTHKDLIAKEFRSLKKKNAVDKEKVEILARAAKEHSSGGDYWALDGGIEAIGYTGKLFSKELADYLILRAGTWQNNAVAAISALREIYRNLDDDDYIAKQNCFSVIQALISESASRMHNLLYQVDVAFIQYLITNLRLQLQSLNINNFSIDNPVAIFGEPLQIIKNILFVATKLQYAVIVEANDIVLVKDSKIPITFSESILNNIFAEAIFNILEKVRHLGDDKDWVDIFKLEDLDESSIYKIEHHFLRQLKDVQLFDRYFDSIREDAGKLLSLYEKLSKHAFITEHSVEKFTEETKTLKATDKGGYCGPWWSLQGGIAIVGYTGIYFNKDLADYLTLRTGYWPDNKRKAIEALEQIRSFLLTQNIEHNEDYYTAVSAYNACIQNQRFNQELAQIEARHQDLSTVTTQIVDPNISGEGSSLKLEEQFQEYCPVALFYNKYYKHGLDNILLLRLKDAKAQQDIIALPAIKLDGNTIKDTLIQVTAKLAQGFNKVIVPCNIEGKHWVGVLFEITVDHIVIVYLDSENQEPPIILKESIVEHLQRHNPRKEIIFNTKSVEQQCYNNCGPEVIENFIYYLTGTRSTQGVTVYVHSLLLENALLDPVEYALRISENSKLIGFLSNQAPLMVDRPITDSNRLLAIFMQQVKVRFEVLSLSEETYLSKLLSPYTHLNAQQTITMFGDSVLLVVDNEVSSSRAQVALFAQNIGAILPIQSGDFSVVSSTALVRLASSRYNSLEQSSQGQGSGLFAFIHTLTNTVMSKLSDGLMNAGGVLMDVIMQNNYINHKLINYVYYDELSAIKAVINKPYIQSSAIPDVQSLLQKHPFQWSEKDFRKIKLVVHPDKGGNDKDFRTINAFQEQVGNKEQMYQNLLPKLIPDIQALIYKTTIGFKSLDTTVDIARLIYEPTFQNVKKVALDSAYLYSMYQGINGVSAMISGSEAIYQTYYGEYTQAFQTATTTIGYMALPSLLAYTAIPCLSLVYGIGIATYTGYSAIINAYSFYLEKTSNIESILRSTTAYRDLTQTLSESPLQQLYDFTSTVRGYESQLNNIALAAEKKALKSKVVEEKGEFDQKLYDYVYEPSLEEKYSLLNQVLQGVITKDETETLKAKHIKISSGEQSYEHCMEIKDAVNNNTSISKNKVHIAENSNGSIEHYYCYNNEQRVFDHILISGDNNFEVVERL